MMMMATMATEGAAGDDTMSKAIYRDKGVKLVSMNIEDGILMYK